MDCISPPPIDDRTLLAHLADDAPPEVAAHLAACAYCADRARDLQAAEARLDALLYRVDCPSAHVLSNLRQGFLTPTERQAVEAHLTRCPHCTADLARLDRFVADIDSSLNVSLTAVARVLVARLISWGEGSSSPSPAYGAVRGDDDPAPRVYETVAVQVILDVEPDPARPARRRLQGLVTPLDPTASDALTEARLIPADGASSTAPIDDLGNFAFADLAPGVYTLTLLGPTLDVWLEAVDLA